jgi:enoyl-[acyl-carrier protein] reductase II
MRVVRNTYTTYYDEHAEELERFPAQLGRSMAEKAFHLGGDENTVEVDPTRECYPAGQGVGAIHELMPAADLVRRFVNDAGDALTRAAAVTAGA